MIFSSKKISKLLLFSFSILLGLNCNKVHVSCILTTEPACDFAPLFSNCAQNTPADFTEYDIFLIIGQSNACSGMGLDPALDGEHPRIKQLGRHDGNDFMIIPAIEPLDHHYRVPGAIGFATTFAREYVCDQLEDERNVLLIPAAMTNTGFGDMHWRPGDDLYEDAVARTNELLKRYPESKLKAFLWQQGEKDVYNPQYIVQLDSMIRQFRREINQEDAQEIPFLLGGMVPYWVDLKAERRQQECLIKATPKRVDRTAFVDPRSPCTIRKENNRENPIHYDAAGQRELGRRYFEAYLQLL